ncbi:hypothetical protein F2P81_013403 [Scophthalmus maximus]|uniref:Death domain-containing protein n=1 Tax=Scophthalmus maximus TaxID=52904 RepID=A0A6A4SJA4_SCOMX|nr:hypothetical protein F2P81_013403 [Scophthalmus maximus]
MKRKPLIGRTPIRGSGFLVVPFLILPYVPTGASAFHLGGSRTRRDDNCRYDLEYRHGNLCCVNCPAGTHLKSHCTRSGEKGKCQECDYGTYTEHGNELNQCFKCTQCRPANAAVIVPLVLILLLAVVIIVGGFFWWKKRRRTTDPEGDLHEGTKAGQTEEPFPKLVPLKGEESLRKCFEYFEEIEFNYQKRFFRHLGINDNVIKSKDPLPYEDRIHELLNIWVEREGRDAALDDLLKALLDLNQRRTAETVKEKAIHNGHYRVCESL